MKTTTQIKIELEKVVEMLTFAIRDIKELDGKIPTNILDLVDEINRLSVEV